jgi:cyclophilin family peptidyl-prolyl cis-trans isomerase/HEAT repeat protein
MKHVLKIAAFGLLFFGLPVTAQVPVATQVAILRAEDSRDYDGLKPFIFSKDLKVQARAILAAARIGDGSSVDALAGLLENGDASIRPLAAFALGETEAEHAAVFILRALADPKISDAVRARAVEAAGKIAAANPTDNDFKALGTAILDVLNAEAGKGKDQNRETVLLALTAALRARPEGADVVTARFLVSPDAAIRTSAGNTMARLRGKNANATLRSMLVSDTEPSARANAARALGAAEDKESLDLLIKAATGDTDSRVRVSAIRSLAALKDAKAADPLLKHGEAMLAEYIKNKKPGHEPVVKSEMLEVAATLGRILEKSDNARAVKFLDGFRFASNYESPEIEVAFAKISPSEYFKAVPKTRNPDETFWKQLNSALQGMAEYAKLPDKGDSLNAPVPPQKFLNEGVRNVQKMGASFVKAIPTLLNAYAEFKTADLDEVLRANLLHPDPFVRAAASGLLADRPSSKENVEALKKAFPAALMSDKHDNDAQLAILDALFKLDKKESVGMLLVALNATDYLVRQRAFTMLENEELEKDFPDIEASLENARAKDKDKVLPYALASGTKLGQILNTDVDYRRAIARKNGSAKAVFTTEKGTFTIDLLPEDAPLTVDNFVKLANAKYFDGLEVHRVVPNFVMQDGDPRGDGNGGPGWSIRCEMNMVPFERGAVGMALSGKDTGGSQWFVTHAAQPHLDGGYTVFGRVNEADMKIVDNIVRGDKIITVKIIGR